MTEDSGTGTFTVVIRRSIDRWLIDRPLHLLGRGVGWMSDGFEGNSARWTQDGDFMLFLREG
jgi:hypothetical protein